MDEVQIVKHDSEIRKRIDLIDFLCLYEVWSNRSRTDFFFNLLSITTYSTLPYSKYSPNSI